MRNTFMLHGQYHYFWWPDGTGIQGISSYDIKLFILEYSNIRYQQIA